MSSKNDRFPPWKPVNEKQFVIRLSAFGPGTSSERFRTETVRKLDEDSGKHVKIYTDGSKMGDKVGYVVDKEEPTIKKRILPQNTVISAEQSAIIEAIQLEKNNRHEIVIITDTVSTIMAAENRAPTKNAKTQTIRKMLDHEGLRITLLWVASHVGRPVNEKTDQVAKEALDEDILRDTRRTT
jgi:ribonuclease HI